MKILYFPLALFLISSVDASELIFRFSSPKKTLKKVIVKKFANGRGSGINIFKHPSNSKCFKKNTLKPNCEIVIVVPEKSANTKNIQKYLIQTTKRETREVGLSIYIGGRLHMQNIETSTSGEKAKVDAEPFGGGSIGGEYGAGSDNSFSYQANFVFNINNSTYYSNEYITSFGSYYTFNDTNSKLGLHLFNETSSWPIIQNRSPKELNVSMYGIKINYIHRFLLSSSFQCEVFPLVNFPVLETAKISDNSIELDRVLTYGIGASINYKGIVVKTIFEKQFNSGPYTVERRRLIFELGTFL